MAFVHRCVVSGPAVSTPIGFMGDETVQVSCEPPPRYNSTGDIETDLMDSDYAALPFSVVVQIIPSEDEFSDPNWNQSSVGNVPKVMANFYNRAYDPDSCSLLPAGVTIDGVDEPGGAREDPIACARMAALLHGTTSTLADDRQFRNAHLGMFVEVIPSDSGLRPEGYELYGPPLMRPVLAESIHGSVFYTPSAPSIAVVCAGYEWLSTDGDKITSEDDRIAVMAAIWQLCKVPSVQVIPATITSLTMDASLVGFNRAEDISTVLRRIQVRTAFVSRALGIKTPFKMVNDFVLKAGTYDASKTSKYLNPFALQETAFTATDHIDSFFLGSPSCPSMLMHMRNYAKKNLTYFFTPEEDVYEHIEIDADTTADMVWRVARWGTGGETVTRFGKKYYQAKVSCASSAEFKVQYDKCGKVKLSNNTTEKKVTIGVSITRHAELLNNFVKEMSEKDVLALFGDTSTIPPEDLAILTEVGKTIHSKTRVPLLMVHLAEFCKSHAFFFDHPYLSEIIRSELGLTFSDDEYIGIKLASGKQACATVASVLGSACVNKISGDKAAALEFEKYVDQPPFTHPILDSLHALVPTRKRRREPNDHNQRAFTDCTLSDVGDELEKRPVRAKWILGEFITVESRNTIRICLRKPWVCM